MSEKKYVAVAALREQEQRRWIPVTERLPVDGVPVLIYCWHDETVEESWLQDGSWGGRFNFHYMSEVSHWMPLPEPPKEDAL